MSVTELLFNHTEVIFTHIFSLHYITIVVNNEQQPQNNN